MKKYIYLILISILISKTCMGEPNLAQYNFESIVGYQQGFGFNNQIIRPAFDYAIIYNLFFNGGVNYQIYYGINGYLGVGFFSFVEIQYGYAFTLHKHMLRIRSDIPLLDIDENTHLFYQDMSLGLFVEQTFNCKGKGTTVGVTISYFLHWDSSRSAKRHMR